MDTLISFEDGKPYEALKCHLGLYGLTPEAYRTKWGLSPDYPMVAASFYEARSALAKSLGLEQVRRKVELEPTSAPEPNAPKQSRGRKAKGPATAD